MTTAEGDALEQGRDAALDGRWDEAIAAFAAAEAAGDPPARRLGLRARLNRVRELVPDPLGPAPVTVERYVQAVQHLEAALLAAPFEDTENEAWRVQTLAEVQQRLFDQLRLARRRFAGQRGATLRLLNNLFLLGSLPSPPPDGRHHGELVALAPGFGLDALLQTAAGLWMPWKGKVFDAATATGENIFLNATMPVTRLLWPGYLGAHPDSPGAYRAFQFRTWTGTGVNDPERQVLKIDYDLSGNPRSVRRILDELVQLGAGVYLGKAHVRGLGRGWRTVAFFALRPEAAPEA